MIYDVIKQWIAGLPQQAYRGGVGAWEGVVMHQTANDSDTARSNAKYEATHWRDAFVHEFIDPYEIIQVANPAYIAYGAGAKANPRFVHLELCSARDQAEFDRSFDRWCWRAAFYLSARKLGVSRAKPDGSGTLWAHADVTKYLGGTTHTDPIAYLQQWGKSWDDVISRVMSHYTSFLKEDEYMLKDTDANKVIGLLGAIWDMMPNAESKEEMHRLANELRKASGQTEQ